MSQTYPGDILIAINMYNEFSDATNTKSVFESFIQIHVLFYHKDTRAPVANTNKDFDMSTEVTLALECIDLCRSLKTKITHI